MRTFVPAALAALLLLAPAARADEPAIDFSELTNGLDLIVVQKHDAPLVTIEIAVKTGSFTETPETNGLSHLYEHMFFKGNAALPTQAEYMRRVAELGISFNGTTSTERVNYFFTLPSRNFAPGMQFMQDALLTPLFDMEEMKSERKVVIGEYDRNEADPMHYLREALREGMYGAEAYRKNPLGERDVILSATRETMHDFRNRFYVPNNACLLVVGDVNLTEVKVLAEKLLGEHRWKRGADPHAVPRPPLPRLAETQTFVVERETPQVVLAARWPGPDVGRDERATFVADVWGTLLSFPHGRFQRTFRDGGLANGVNMYYFTQREGGEIGFTAAVRDGKWQGVRDALLAEVAAMAEPGYWSEEELALAKRTLRIGRAYEAQQGADLSHTLSFWWASSSLDYYRRYLDAVETVTPEELRAYVRDYLVGRPMVLGALASPENVAKLGITAEALRPAVDGDAAAATAVSELRLGNGLRVIFRREPAAAVAGLQLFVDGGCLTLPEELQGIDKLLFASVLDGSQRTPREQVQARLVGLGAQVGNDANYDFSRLAVAAPRETFAEAVALVAECLKEPLFDPTVVAQRRSQMKDALQAEQASPDNYVVRVTNERFFAGHPYGLRPDGTLGTLDALTPEALRARLGEVLTSGRALVVLVADMSEDEARALLEQELGWIRTAPFDRPSVPPFTPGGLVGFDERADIPTTYVLGKAPAPAPGHPDYPAARLALAMLHKRLWETLRTKYALTYAPGAGLSIFRGNYSYVAASTTEPARAIELMFEEIRRLQEEPIEAAELAGLVSQQETRAYAGRESAVNHAQGLGAAELIEGSWRGYYTLPSALAKVTPQDVQRVARQYLAGFTWGLIGPKSVPEEVLKGGTSGSK